jgi:hypothetical protein
MRTKPRVGRRGCGCEWIDWTRSRPGLDSCAAFPEVLSEACPGAVVAALKRAIGLLRAFGGLGHRAQASALFDLSRTRREVKSK